MTDQLNNSRRAFDERLLALESGLADPDSSPALASLVLDMVRAVSDEAETAGRDAALQAQRSAEAMLSTALAQAQAAQVQLESERALVASLRADIASLREQLATAVIARQDADAAHQRELAAVTATIAELQQAVDDANRAAARAAGAVRERDELAHDLHARAAEHDALVAERDGLAEERKKLTADCDALTTERDSLAAERATRVDDRTLAVAERDALVIERTALMVERDALASAHAGVAAERDRLMSERADFLRTHDAMVLQRDTLTHERDDIMRDRDRQIAQLHADLDAREAALKETREKAAAAPPPAQKQAAGSAPANGPIRKTDRKAFLNALGVQIDGEAALLVDLSTTGAQVLSCSALKPARTVKMLLPSSEAPVLCRGRIVWARLEPTMPGKPIRYRAGMFFTATDQAAVQIFIARHGSHGARA